MGLWSEEFVSEIAFSKCCSFDSGDFIKPKLGQKEPKIVFHVLVVIEKWFFFSFESPWRRHQSQNGSKKVQTGISCTNVDKDENQK